jgi:hypothetical protein
MEGHVEIIATDARTGEIVYHDEGHNQLQNWCKDSLSYILAGRQFCSLGNHGEPVTDVGGNPYKVLHLKDGKTLVDGLDLPIFKYNDSLKGMVQQRTIDGGDSNDLNLIQTGQTIYPFFPTKMRFGQGGLDDSQNPKDNIPFDATTLQDQINNISPEYDDAHPFITIDRERTTQHIIVLNNGAYATKITYSVRLPHGSGLIGDLTYRYNGKVISEAGLYCDAALIYGSDTRMRTGMMLAYRTFKGIVKDESIDLLINWSIIV